MAFPDDFVGIPFKAGGRTEAGLDCWGLARLVYKSELNVILPSYSDECRAGDGPDRYAELIELHKDRWAPVKAPEPFDLLELRVDGEPSHIGIVVKPRHTFLHAWRGSHSGVERYDNQGHRWRHRVLGHYRLKALAR